MKFVHLFTHQLTHILSTFSLLLCQGLGEQLLCPTRQRKDLPQHDLSAGMEATVSTFISTTALGHKSFLSQMGCRLLGSTSLHVCRRPGNSSLLSLGRSGRQTH